MFATAEVLTRRFIRVRERNQITIPNEIISSTPIAVGDFLEIVLTQDGSIHMMPTKLITSINSPEARQQEALADKDIANKDYDTFHSANDLMKEVARKRRGRRKVAATAIAVGAAAGSQR